MSKKIKEVNQIAVIGLGRFGSALVKSLVEMGREVLAIDIDEARVNAVAEIATTTVVADSTDESVLEAIDIQKFDAVVICIGENLQSSALTTLMCKEAGAKYVVSKASTEKHKAILQKIGADLVIVPEIDSGRKLASTLSHRLVADVLELTPNYLLVEIPAQNSWENKSLMELNFRNNYGINVIIIKRNGGVILNPDGNTILKMGDNIIIGGINKDIDRFCDNF